MDNFNLDPNLIPDVSCSQQSKEAYCGASGAIGSQPCMSFFSVQTLESSLSNYVGQSDAVQNNAYSVNPLNQYAVAAPTSVSNFISTYNLVDFPPDELDVYLGTKETASDELISTQQNVPTDTSTSLQGASCSKTSVNSSQPSPHPVTIFNPQQEAQTEAGGVNPLLTVSQSDAVQNNAYFVNPLNQYVAASTSDSNFISNDNLVNFPLGQLDEYLCTKETASDELISTELNPPTDTYTPLNGASCGKTSVNFSQSSPHPVAIFNPQQEVQTEAESDNPLLTSSKGKAAGAKCDQSPARKAARKEYDQSPARQAARKEYQQSPAGKAAKAKYNKSPAGKAARAKYNKSPAGKAARAAKARSQAVRSAREYAYITELAKSGNKEIAKQKGEEAAAEKKRSLLQNRSVDQIAPLLFSHQTE